MVKTVTVELDFKIIFYSVKLKFTKDVGSFFFSKKNTLSIFLGKRKD